MAAKKLFPLIVIGLAISVTAPQSRAQSAATTGGSAQDCPPSPLEKPEAQWLSLLAEKLPSERGLNASYAEGVPADSRQKDFGTLAGKCEVKFVQINPRSPKGEWVEEVTCVALLTGDRCLRGNDVFHYCKGGRKVDNPAPMCQFHVNPNATCYIIR